MIQASRIIKAAVIVMAGATGIVSLAGVANARTIYYGETVTFREAKRMCAGIHGRVFLSDRDVYACQGEQRARRRVYIPPPPPPPQDEPPVLYSKASDKPVKQQNFSGRNFSDSIGKVGGEGNGGNGGSGGNGGTGGSAGGPF